MNTFNTLIYANYRYLFIILTSLLISYNENNYIDLKTIILFLTLMNPFNLVVLNYFFKIIPPYLISYFYFIIECFFLLMLNQYFMKNYHNLNYFVSLGFHISLLSCISYTVLILDIYPLYLINNLYIIVNFYLLFEYKKYNLYLLLVNFIYYNILGGIYVRKSKKKREEIN